LKQQDQQKNSAKLNYLKKKEGGGGRNKEKFRIVSGASETVD
jgi:hypothetical protein